MTDNATTYEGWSICELFGHRRLAGWVSSVEVAGAGFLRIDVPSECSATSDRWCPVCGDCRCPTPEVSLDDPGCPLHAETSKHGDFLATQFLSAASIYSLTPVTEAVARAVAKHNVPEPVARWELPKPEPAAAARTPRERDLFERDAEDARDDGQVPHS